VPKYSNPTGEIYSDETVQRLAAMQTGAADFRLFWDNAYAVHHLTDHRHEIANILDLCERAGNPDRALVFASTSKVTLAGAGLAFFASSLNNLRWYLGRAAKRTIGPDKLNQLRHVRFLRNEEGLHRLMNAHRALLAPKFAAVLTALESRLAGTGVAQWSRPEGGYFINVDLQEGAATHAVELARRQGRPGPSSGIPMTAHYALLPLIRVWQKFAMQPKESPSASCWQPSSLAQV
jgi:DNA-binding transcriptional MocR family regulator